MSKAFDLERRLESQVSDWLASKLGGQFSGLSWAEAMDDADPNAPWIVADDEGQEYYLELTVELSVREPIKTPARMPGRDV